VIPFPVGFCYRQVAILLRLLRMPPPHTLAGFDRMTHYVHSSSLLGGKWRWQHYEGHAGMSKCIGLPDTGNWDPLETISRLSSRVSRSRLTKLKEAHFIKGLFCFFSIKKTIQLICIGCDFVPKTFRPKMEIIKWVGWYESGLDVIYLPNLGRVK
jgi:hypothetical protein